VTDGFYAELLFGATGYDVARLGEQAATVAAAGYHGVWAGEINNLDAVSVLALAGGAVSDGGLGAFVSAFSRAPATLAMTGAALARAFPSRVALALGAGSKVLVEDWSGIPFERPYGRVRDVLRFLRDALAGERVHDDFATFRAAGFRLAETPTEPPRLYVAGVNPNMVQLGLEEADGVVLNWCGLEDAAAVAARAGRPGAVATVVQVCPSADQDIVRRLAIPLVVNYLSVPGYARLQERLGRAPMLAAMWAHLEVGDRAAASAAIPQAVIDDLFIWGTPAECRARVDQYAAHGVRAIVTFLTPDQDALARRPLVLVAARRRGESELVEDEVAAVVVVVEDLWAFDVDAESRDELGLARAQEVEHDLHELLVGEVLVRRRAQLVAYGAGL
jgi:probable F420-dependent oxidoreductase